MVRAKMNGAKGSIHLPILVMMNWKEDEEITSPSHRRLTLVDFPLYTTSPDTRQTAIISFCSIEWTSSIFDSNAARPASVE